MRKIHWPQTALALTLSVLMVWQSLSFSTLKAAADPTEDTADQHPGQVHVLVENNTEYHTSDGAAWDGVCVDQWVDVDETTSTIQSVAEAALNRAGVAYTISSGGGFSAIGGLGSSGEGYFMATLNDWFTNYGMLEAGKLKAGDEVCVQFSAGTNWGADIGSLWENTDTSLNAVSFSVGSLSPAFDSDTHDYTLTIPAGTDSVVASPAAVNKNFQVRTTSGGTQYQRLQKIPVTEGTVITITCGDPSWPSMNDTTNVTASVYTFTVHITAEYVITLTNGDGYTLIPADTSVTSVSEGGSYRFSVTIREGYEKTTDFAVKANDQTLTETDGQYTVSDIQENQIITVTGVQRTAAPGDNDPDPGYSYSPLNRNLSAYWPNFRGTSADNSGDQNMVIREVKLARSADEAALKWSTQPGDMSKWETPTPPLVVDNSIITAAGKKIYKLSAADGSVMASGEMADQTSWSMAPLTYADGMIFVPLYHGKVEAFNAETLQPLWVYEDPSQAQYSASGLTVQVLSPVAYADGIAYAGFYCSETEDENFVTIDTTDWDTTRGDEAPLVKWRFTQKGGFYWAGPAIVWRAVITGTEDGETGSNYITPSDGTSHIYALDKSTGEVISKLDLTHMGDVRSSIAYDSASGRIFFTTKAGYVGSAAVDENGILSDLKSVSYGVPMTSTPVVYKGRVYVAASGLTQGAKGSIIVADAGSLQKIYAADLSEGYPQCSLLLSTGYEQTTGYLYLYVTYNDTPGGLLVMKAKADAGSAGEVQVSKLYTPEAGAQNYCICSPICGEDGTIYYKNDSGNVLAVRHHASPLKVEYSVNGCDSGSAPVDDTLYYRGESVTIPDNTGHLTRNGYTFDGWNTKADGSGRHYRPGDKVPVEEIIASQQNAQGTSLILGKTENRLISVILTAEDSAGEQNTSVQLYVQWKKNAAGSDTASGGDTSSGKPADTPQDSAGTQKTSTSTPAKTGDSFHAGQWAAVLAACLILAAVTIKKYHGQRDGV